MRKTIISLLAVLVMLSCSHETDKEGQFPFDIPQYLLIDMQLGGAWVGSVDPTHLPVEMEVDWVRYYQWK